MQAYWRRGADDFLAAPGTTWPTAWLRFRGFFGDDTLPDSDPRQARYAEGRRYEEGPTGPRDKALVRTSMGPTPDTPLHGALD